MPAVEHVLYTLYSCSTHAGGWNREYLLSTREMAFISCNAASWRVAPSYNSDKRYITSTCTAVLTGLFVHSLDVCTSIAYCCSLSIYAYICFS